MEKRKFSLEEVISLNLGLTGLLNSTWDNDRLSIKLGRFNSSLNPIAKSAELDKNKRLKSFGDKKVNGFTYTKERLIEFQQHWTDHCKEETHELITPNGISQKDILRDDYLLASPFEFYCIRHLFPAGYDRNWKVRKYRTTNSNIEVLNLAMRSFANSKFKNLEVALQYACFMIDLDEATIQFSEEKKKLKNSIEKKYKEKYKGRDIDYIEQKEEFDKQVEEISNKEIIFEVPYFKIEDLISLEGVIKDQKKPPAIVFETFYGICLYKEEWEEISKNKKSLKET